MLSEPVMPVKRHIPYRSVAQTLDPIWLGTGGRTAAYIWQAHTPERLDAG